VKDASALVYLSICVLVILSDDGRNMMLKNKRMYSVQSVVFVRVIKTDTENVYFIECWDFSICDCRLYLHFVILRRN
jgi:hypothetical protein